MRIKTEIDINKEELTNLLKEHFKIDGDVKYIIEEEEYPVSPWLPKVGMTDSVQHYSSRYVFSGVEITSNNVVKI